jgi:hypothetical protein
MDDKVPPRDKDDADSNRKVIAKVTKCLSGCVCKGEYHANLLAGSYVVECFCDCHGK